MPAWSNTRGGYHWSSFAANGQAKPAALWTPHDIWLRLGQTNEVRAARYRATFQGHLEPAQLAVIRTALNKGPALGDERFKHEIEQPTGVRISLRKAGRKPSSDDEPAGQRQLLL